LGLVGNGLAGNGGSRLGQSSPVSAVAGEVREKKKKKKKKKKPRACVECFDFILNLYIFLKRMRRQFMIGGKKPHFFAMTI
jgi:hypothetical protein